MKKMRQAHLWIGLVTSAFLLMEAVTGLLLTEPWLMGQQPKSRPMSMQEQGQPSEGKAEQTQPPTGNLKQGEKSIDTDSKQKEFGSMKGFPKGEGENSLMGIVKGLHEGRLGDMDIKWIIDIAAISMIFLTLSGVYLSVKLLRAQRKSRKLKESEAH
ncbi:PepSY-associated TM helix domain-containing protein [Thermoflavimicrobium dichotomicum]|uniref:PepSY-associated TM region n=1 Tax=Thermoflavimicrobium dichotomicum TaxID=46223 RepID=A0A1I3JMS0_9BACL|nr:PepSY-associated TM region [Thermoflavimicrobium dichotomicum]